jgi:plastocyanin
MTKRLLPVAVSLLATVAVAACGGGGSSSGGPPKGSVVVKMTDFKYDPNTITHAHGSITFFLENNGTSAHDLTIFDSSGKQISGSELVQPGNDSSYTVTLSTPGTYQFWCTQPGHKDAGMTGTLTIT